MATKVKSQFHLPRNEDASVTSLGTWEDPLAWENAESAWTRAAEARALSDALTERAKIVVWVNAQPVNEGLEDLIRRSTSEYGLDWELLRRLNTEAWGADED